MRFASKAGYFTVLSATIYRNTLNSEHLIARAQRRTHAKTNRSTWLPLPVPTRSTRRCPPPAPSRSCTTPSSTTAAAASATFSSPPFGLPSRASAFEFWNKRAYHRVYENRLESNTPLVNCCPMDGCLTDMVSVKFFDKDAKFAPWKRATCCTPFHSLCFSRVPGRGCRHRQAAVGEQLLLPLPPQLRARSQGCSGLLRCRERRPGPGARRRHDCRRPSHEEVKGLGRERIVESTRPKPAVGILFWQQRRRGTDEP